MSDWARQNYKRKPTDNSISVVESKAGGISFWRDWPEFREECNSKMNGGEWVCNSMKPSPDPEWFHNNNHISQKKNNLYLQNQAKEKGGKGGIQKGVLPKHNQTPQ